MGVLMNRIEVNFVSCLLIDLVYISLLYWEKSFSEFDSVKMKPSNLIRISTHSTWTVMSLIGAMIGLEYKWLTDLTAFNFI